MMTDPKTFTLAELLLHATEFQWDGLTIAAIVEDPSSAKTVEPKIHGWNVIDTAAGNWLLVAGGYDSGPDMDDDEMYEALDEVHEALDEDDDGSVLIGAAKAHSSRHTFASIEATFAAAVAYRDEQARRGL